MAAARRAPARSSRAQRRAPVRPFYRAFAVHIFTALGAGCALLALVGAARGDFVAMFGWLGVALLIDGVDGSLARRFNVESAAPRWSGESIDFVVDFTTYVFVPAFALARGALLPDAVALPLAAAIVVTGALYFADREMKSDDNHFRGFPVLWNVLAFHLFLLKLPPWIAACVVALFLVLTFAPLRVIHPLRVERGRVLNIGAVLAWAALAAGSLALALDPPPVMAWLATICGLYILGIGSISPRK